MGVVSMNLKKQLAYLLVASGFVAVGNITGPIWSFTPDDSPPELKIEQIELGRMKGQDHFKLVLPFDRPVRLRWKMVWRDPIGLGNDLPQTYEWDGGDAVATRWQVLHKFGAGIPWTSTVLAEGMTIELHEGRTITIDSLDIEYQSIGGGEWRTRSW